MSKVHVTLQEDVREGYFWASPRNKKFRGDFTKFDDQFSYGELEEIYAPNFLDYIKLDQRNDILEGWMKLLKIGGKLVIGGTDPFILARKISNREVSVEGLNEFLFNTSARIYGFTPLNTMRTALFNKAFKIEEIYVDENTAKYTIVSLRGNPYE